MGEGDLKKLPRILGISFGKQKLRRLFWHLKRNTCLEIPTGMPKLSWDACQRLPHLFGREQAQWEERVAKHVAYKEKFEVEAEEAHLRSTTWFTKMV